MLRRRDMGPTLAASMVRRFALVNLTTGNAVRGVVWAADETGLVIVQSVGQPAEFITPDGEAKPMDGSAFIPAALVEFVQLPNSG